MESLDFEWDSHGAVWEERLSESLPTIAKLHGHCVPKRYSENKKIW
jgi:hypothetical protein